MTTHKGTKAWVVRWDWQGDRTAVDQPVAAILRPQTSADQVRRIVEILCAAREYAPDEMLYSIRRKGHNPYPARFSTIDFDPDGRGQTYQVPWEGEIYCGHNPLLIARRARVWPLGDGSGRVEWEDDPRP
jgi:hypothetical protein